MIMTKIEDPAIIYELLMGCKENKCDIFVWKMVGGEEHLGAVQLESVSRSRRDFSIIPHDNHEEDVQNLMMHQSYIDFYIPNAQLLFRCQIKTNGGPIRYTLQLPSEVSQIDRRSARRVNTEDERFKVSFQSQNPYGQTQQFVKNCFDVSAGGMSFYVSKIERKFFQEGGVLKDILIDSSEWKTQVTAQMVLVKELEPNEFNNLPYRVWRVCCRFKGVDEKTRQLLDQYIFERIKGELHAING